MRTPLLSLLASALLATGPLSLAPLAAQTTQDQFEVAFQSYESQRRQTIAGLMAFNEQEAAQFWPIYDQYRLSAKTLQLRRLRLAESHSHDTVGMDAKTARTVMQEAMAIDLEEHNAKADYLNQLDGIFEGARYFRLFQIETKLNAMIRLALTRQIPLAVTEEEMKRLEMGAATEL